MRLLAIFAVIALAFWLLPQAWPFWLFAFMLSPGMCCCQTCKIVTDDFSSNDLASAWTTASSGSWSISSGTLSTSSANAYLIATALHPSGNSAMSISCDATAAASSLIRLIVAWKDSSNYIYGEIKIESSGAANDGYMRVYQVVGGSITLVGDSGNINVPASTPVAYTMCVDSSQTSATLSGDPTGGGTLSIGGHSLTIPAGSSGYGLGSGSPASSLAFTSFSASRTDNGCPGCPTGGTVTGCAAICSGSIMGYESTITLPAFSPSNPSWRPVPSVNPPSSSIYTGILATLVNGVIVPSSGCGWNAWEPTGSLQPGPSQYYWTVGGGLVFTGGTSFFYTISLSLMLSTPGSPYAGSVAGSDTIRTGTMTLPINCASFSQSVGTIGGGTYFTTGSSGTLSVP